MMFSYTCPDCGTQLRLRMRVTQTKRRCPHCGTPVTPAVIDQQQREHAEAMRRGCVPTAIMLLVLAVIAGYVLNSGPTGFIIVFVVTMILALVGVASSYYRR